MSVLTSATVLDLWEAGLTMTPASRAALLLQATGETELSSWPVGRRDQALLENYCSGGRTLDAVAECPECGTALDVAFDPGALGGAADADTVTIEINGYLVRARPPTTGDLQALPAGTHVETLRMTLLERCVLTATHQRAPVTARELPGDVVAAVETALDNADPAADIRMALTCADCGASWSESLDPVLFAWSAVEASARRLATDVHALAHTYGWSEHEILALSPFRRHLYLSAVRS